MNGIPRVLLIDDDDIDAEAFRRTMRSQQVACELTHVRTATEALTLLEEDRGPEYPFLTVLDLAMPQMTGFEFLDCVRSTPHLRHLPVIVFTTSNQDRDREQAFERGIIAYVVKNRGSESCAELLTLISTLWRHSELPPATAMRT